MRIVNICLGVLVVVVAAMPLLSGDVTAYAVGHAAGTVCVAALAAAVFAAVAWFAGGREPMAREAGIAIGLVLAMVMTVRSNVEPRATTATAPAPSPREREVATALPSSTLDEAQAFADEMLWTHPYRLAAPNSDGGKAYASAESLLKKSYHAIDGVIDSGAAVNSTYWDVIATAQTKEELLALKEEAAAFQEKARHCADFFSKFEQTYEDELRSRGVSARMQKSQLAEFEREMRGYDRELVNLANLHTLLADHLQSLIDVLITEWGKWRYIPESKGVGFTDPQALDSYNIMIGLLKECVQKIQSTDL